ncbi:protein-export chaperone SecB [Streptococcus parauberis]|uniref:protein-export chaperone SecB n=1 Tax=Streptococcus parauberis TaxID=1348 RepID=UPI003795A51B
MANYDSELIFKDYLVRSSKYSQNNNFSFETDSLEVNFDIDAVVQISENDAAVTLNCKCGDSSNVNCPFEIEVSVMGIFEHKGEISKLEFESMLTTNSIAILFPYLRSLISDISGQSNIYPSYKLPLINVIQFLHDEEKIQITHV